MLTREQYQRAYRTAEQRRRTREARSQTLRTAAQRLQQVAGVSVPPSEIQSVHEAVAILRVFRPSYSPYGDTPTTQLANLTALYRATHPAREDVPA